jgi:hypothetical protein
MQASRRRESSTDDDSLILVEGGPSAAGVFGKRFQMIQKEEEDKFMDGGGSRGGGSGKSKFGSSQQVSDYDCSFQSGIYNMFVMLSFLLCVVFVGRDYITESNQVALSGCM